MVEFIVMMIGHGVTKFFSNFYRAFDAVVALSSLLSLIFLIISAASGINLGGK